MCIYNIVHSRTVVIVTGVHVVDHMTCHLSPGHVYIIVMLHCINQHTYTALLFFSKLDDKKNNIHCVLMTRMAKNID